MDINTYGYESPLGVLKICSNEDQIISVEYAHENIQSLHKEEEPAPVIQECIRQLDQYFSGKELHFTLPLQQAGTAFQQSVWSLLLKIKPGETYSYLQLSKRLGNPKAIRAVGTANGANNIAIIVPCHRVIGSTGNLVGYAGGLWRKKWLLDHEAKHCHGIQALF